MKTKSFEVRMEWVGSQRNPGGRVSDKSSKENKRSILLALSSISTVCAAVGILASELC